MHINIITLATAMLGSVCVATIPRQKRQGLFSCSGWGASCTNGGWRVQPPPKRPPPLTIDRENQGSKPITSNRRFWLTTDKAWGPVGKRTNMENPSFIQTRRDKRGHPKRGNTGFRIQKMDKEKLP